MVGEGARNLVARALGPGAEADSGVDAAEAARLDEALRQFIGHYRQVCLDATRPYTRRIPELLEALAPRYPMSGVQDNKHFASPPPRPPRPRPPLPHRRRRRHPAHPQARPAGMRLLAERLAVPLAEMMLIGDSGSTPRRRTTPAAGSRLVTWGFVGKGQVERVQEQCDTEVIAKDPRALTLALPANSQPDLTPLFVGGVDSEL